MSKIIEIFEDFITKHGGRYSDFYIGIASDPEDRLKNGHGVSSDIPNTYYPYPIKADVVREIEKYFLDRGCKGGPGGGDDHTTFIYCYLITPKTREN